MTRTFGISPNRCDSANPLTTLTLVPKCQICGGEFCAGLADVYDSVTGEAFEIQRCESCGLGITVPHPPEPSPYYKNYYGARHGVSAGFRARRRLSLVAKVTGRKGGRLLDIGCGDGCFLAAARDAGFQVTGTETNPEPARRRGIEVFENLDECCEPGFFDCVTLWHSLEHMEDPRSVLARARVLLRPEGHLVVAVPDAGGMQARLFGRHWLHLDVPRHLFHFSLKSLNRLLAAEDFRVVQARHQEFEYDVMGWSQSTLNALGMRQNAFLKLMMGRDVGASIPQRARLLFGGVVLSVLSIPLTYFCALARSGGTLVMVAQTARQP